MDFIEYKTQEINCVINGIKNEQYTGMYDFHEHSATTGFLLYFYAQHNRQLANSLLEMLEKNNIPLENEYVDIILKSKNGAIYVPFYAKWYYTGIQKSATSGIYFDKINVQEVFVFETPLCMEMEQRKRIIHLLLQYLTKT
jgi:hypothetical protein